MPQSPSLTSYSPTIAEVNLGNFRSNIQRFRAHVNCDMLMAVIKTNAYGHGIIPIGHEAVRAGVNRLGVTSVEEGAQLRESGITAPIHLLSSIQPERANDVVSYDLTASISSEKLAYAMNKAAIAKHKQVPVHLKIDTGLHRFGIAPGEALTFCESCFDLPGLVWEGIYTHFSSADEGDWTKTKQQFDLFMETVAILQKRGFDFPIHHVGASTIAMERPEMHLDMVRPGIALFGYHPEIRQQDILSLSPVMTLKSKLMHVRKLPPNTPVGYGGNYVTHSEQKIAVVPIGHGDGCQRRLSDKGEMLVRGKRARIVGEISLDQTFIDVTHIPDAAEGDEVVLIGKQGNDEISACEVAGWMDSIVDEVLASLMERIRRVYV